MCVEMEVLFLSRVIYIGRDISSLMVHLEAGANYSLRHHALTARSKQRLALSRNNMMVNVTSSHLGALHVRHPTAAAGF